MKSYEIPLIPARQLVWWTVGVVIVLGCFWLLWRFQDILLLLLTAVIFSTAVRPGVRWLEKRGIPQPVGILLIFVTIATLLGLLFWYSLPVLSQQGSAIMQNLADGYIDLRQSLLRLPNILIRRIAFMLPMELPMMMSGAELPIAETGLETPAGGWQNNPLIKGVFYFVTIVILTFFWILEESRLKQAAFLLVPLKKREEIRDLIQAIETKVSGYLLGQGLLCLIIGVLAFIAYSVIGLPNALLLAILAGLLEAVPIVGPFLGAVPAVIVGLSISPLTALWVIVASVIIQQLENTLLVPRVMRRTIGVRPLVTLLALLAFGSLFGILGALIALPLAAIIQILLDRYLLAQEDVSMLEPGRDELSVLRYETNQLVQDVRNQVRQKDVVPSALTDEVEDELEAIALSLESYLAEKGSS